MSFFYVGLYGTVQQVNCSQHKRISLLTVVYLVALRVYVDKDPLLED